MKALFASAESGFLEEIETNEQIAGEARLPIQRKAKT